MTRSAVQSALLFSLSSLVAVGCTGLMAGPVQPSSSTALMGVSPDSAYKRARSNLGTEVFTILEENPGHWIKARRYPSSSAKADSPNACQLILRVEIEPEEVKTIGQWAVDEEATTDKGRSACDEELVATQGRIEKFAANSQ